MKLAQTIFFKPNLDFQDLDGYNKQILYRIKPVKSSD
jgi:hypothetical protein